MRLRKDKGSILVPFFTFASLFLCVKEEEMETTNFSKLVTVPVALKGGSNYLMWSQLVRTTIGRLGLWNHITDDGPEPVAKEDEEEGDGKTLAVAEAKRWVQEDLMVLSVLHASLELPILEAYVHFETPKRLWDMLHKRYGNKSNISRVFDLKQTISVLRQDGEDDLYKMFMDTSFISSNNASIS